MGRRQAQQASAQRRFGRCASESGPVMLLRICRGGVLDPRCLYKYLKGSHLTAFDRTNVVLGYRGAGYRRIVVWGPDHLAWSPFRLLARYRKDHCCLGPSDLTQWRRAAPAWLRPLAHPPERVAAPLKA